MPKDTPLLRKIPGTVVLVEKSEYWNQIALFLKKTYGMFYKAPYLVSCEGGHHDMPKALLEVLPAAKKAVDAALDDVAESLKIHGCILRVKR
jgi:hypothetical protein